MNDSKVLRPTLRDGRDCYNKHLYNKPMLFLFNPFIQTKIQGVSFQPKAAFFVCVYACLLHECKKNVFLGVFI